METDQEQFEIECPKCGEPNCWAHGIVEMPEVSPLTEILNKQISDNADAFYEAA